tara:strand:+ start:851 stop:1129 length:279 start_codon:yes stop_codon:yes gene_type:complete
VHTRRVETGAIRRRNTVQLNVYRRKLAKDRVGEPRSKATSRRRCVVPTETELERSFPKRSAPPLELGHRDLLRFRRLELRSSARIFLPIALG